MQSTQVKYIFTDPFFLSTNLAFSEHGTSHFRLPITASARKKKRAFGSIRSTRIMLQSAYIIASKLKILPEPLDILIREFGNGNGDGGGFTFWKGGNGWWGGFDGRKKKINLGVILVIVVVVGGMLWLILEKEMEIDVFFGVLVCALFGVSVNVWKKRVLDWALGFCCCAALVGSVMLKDDLQRFFGTIKIVRRSRRKRRLF